jgi:2-(1,2-epoxy-1,2-dihydrophenyl)acetyl-CoA isomerase
MLTVGYTLEDGVARVTLDRPETLNAWTTELGIELKASLEQASADPAVRCVVLTGAGRAFSSGADLGTRISPDDVLRRLRESFNPIVLTVRTMPKPVVAMVNGPAVGIGCALALAADIVIAAESAYFLLAFVNIGLSLDGGASAWLASRLGHARALQMAFDGQKIDAVTAERWNLVNAVVPDDLLEEEVARSTSRYAAGPPSSYAHIKQLLNERLYPDLVEHLDREAVLQRAHLDSADFADGVAAFAERRAAVFRPAPDSVYAGQPVLQSDGRGAQR